MNPFSWLFGQSSSAADETNAIAEIFPLSLKSDPFVKSDILQTYSKILTDVAERTHGLKEEQEPLLWDSAVATAANEGLITLLATAMTEQKELFLVLKSGVLRKATSEEEKKIREDYKARGESKAGVFVSFKDYQRTEMLRIYSAFEYCLLGSLNKTLNVAKSVQIKIEGLRQSVALADSAVAIAQGKSMAEAMRKGNDLLLDAKDIIDSAKPDTAPTEKAMLFLDSKRAFILGLPLSYVMGEQTAGIGSTGEADMRAVERGLRQYFVSIIRPVFEALFGVDVEFKSQDFRQISTALEVLKTFDLASNEHLSDQTKADIVARVFDIDPDEEAKRIEAEQKEAEAERLKNPPTVPGATPNGLVNGVQTGAVPASIQ